MDTLTFTPERHAELVGLFVQSRDTLAARVREMGETARANAGADGKPLSAARIFDALAAGFDILPVGLRLASVSNALSAYALAHDMLSAEAAPQVYADVLTGIHAVRVKPLRAAWEAACREIPAADDAARVATLADAIKAATPEKRVNTPAETAEADAPADDAETAQDDAPAEPEPEAAPLAERMADTLAGMLAAVGGIDDAEAALILAAASAELSAALSARAAELTPAPVAAPKPRAPRGTRKANA